MTGVFVVVSLATAVLAQEAIQIANEVALPGQLQANLRNVESAQGSPAFLNNLLTDPTGGDYELALQLF